MRIIAIDHLVLTVSHLESSLNFYCHILGGDEIRFGENRVAVGIGGQKINLHVAGAEVSPHAQVPMCGSGDICFMVDTTIHEVIEHLESHNIAIALGPVKRTGAIGDIISVYIRDPDGNLVELSQRLLPLVL